MGRLTERRSTVFGQKIRLASRRTGSQGVAHTHSPANQDAEAKKKKKKRHIPNLGSISNTERFRRGRGGSAGL